jgi:hypothetical protein
MAWTVWRGHSCPRNLAAKSADRSLVSLPARSIPGRVKPGQLRGLRAHLRKERRTPHRPGSSPTSLPREHPRACPGRSNPAECPILPASRRSRHSRHPPLSRERHSHNRPPVTQLVAVRCPAGTTYRSRRARLPSGHKQHNFRQALAADVSAQFHSRVFYSHNKKQKATPQSSVAFRNAIYCAGVVGVAGAAGATGVAGALAVMSVAGLIFTVARIFSSR